MTKLADSTSEADPADQVRRALVATLVADKSLLAKGVAGW
jgi:hypothetical protein